MFFGIGFSELLIIAGVAVVMFGPDRLPELARSAARLVANLRRLAQQTQDQLRSELGPDFADLRLTDLDPRAAIRRHVLDPIDQTTASVMSTATLPVPERLEPGTPPPFDVDAT